MLFVCADHFRRRNSFRICFQHVCVCVCLSFLAVGSLSISSFSLSYARSRIYSLFVHSFTVTKSHSPQLLMCVFLLCIVCVCLVRSVPSVFVASALKFSKNNFFFYVINFCRLVAFLSVLCLFCCCCCSLHFSFVYCLFVSLDIYSHMQAPIRAYIDTCMGVSRAQHIYRMHGVNVNRKQQI